MGGLFFRSADPKALRKWYADNVGVVDPPGGVWRQEAGPTDFAPFSRDTGYFGRPEQAFMANFRVRDLGAMLAQLRRRGGGRGRSRGGGSRAVRLDRRPRGQPRRVVGTASRLARGARRGRLTRATGA